MLISLYVTLPPSREASSRSLGYGFLWTPERLLLQWTPSITPVDPVHYAAGQPCVQANCLSRPSSPDHPHRMTRSPVTRMPRVTTLPPNVTVHTREPINPRSLPLWKNGRIGNERALIGESLWWSKIQLGLVGPALRGRGERDQFFNRSKNSRGWSCSPQIVCWAGVQRGGRRYSVGWSYFWSGLVGDTA